MKIKVTGCKDCPFAETQEDHCLHPSIEGFKSIFDYFEHFNVQPVYKYPNWCPLLDESITIEKISLYGI